MNLSPLPIQKFFDNNGRPLSGGLLFTYAAGTTTKVATYTDASGLSVNTNPIALNYRGEANVWLDQTLTYKFVLAPTNDTDPPTHPIWTVDNISAAVTFASLTQQIIGQLLYPRTAAEIAASVTPVNYAYQTLDPVRYGAVADNSTNDYAAINNAILVAVQISAIAGGVCVIDLKGRNYAHNQGFNVPSNVVVRNGRTNYTGSTAGTAFWQIGITGGGTRARPAGVEDMYATTASTASGLVGFRMDSLVRSCWFSHCIAEMNEDTSGTRGQFGFELIAERLAVTSSTGCYENEVIDCTGINCNAALHMKTRGTGAQQLADPQVNGNKIDIHAFSCVRSAAILEEGALENEIRIRADTFVTQTGLGTTIYVLEVLGGYNIVLMHEEIGTRADTQYSIHLGADSFWNIIEYHTQNVVTARVKNDSTTSRNTIRWLRPTQSIGGELITHAFYAKGVTVGTVQSIVDQWIAPAPCVVVRCALKLDSAVLTAGNFDGYFAKNGSFATDNRIRFTVGQGTTASYIEGDASAGTPIQSDFIFAKGDTMALAVTNSGTGGTLSGTLTFAMRFLSTESDG